MDSMSSDIWPGYPQDRPSVVHAPTPVFSSEGDPDIPHLQPHLNSEQPTLANVMPHLSSHTLPQEMFIPPFPSGSDPSHLVAPRPSVLQPNPVLDHIESSPFQQQNFFSQMPFPPYFPFPDFDYRHEHSHPPVAEPLSMPHLKEEPKPNYAQRGFGRDDLLLHHISPMFPYPMSTLDMAQLAKKNEPKDHDPYERENEGSSSSYTTGQVDDSNRVVHDCQVCHSTQANGLHFGARTCAACAAFFRRTISEDKKYACKRSQRCNNPSRDGTGYRKICRACRLKRCMEIGMMPENVQHKRIHHRSPSQLSFDGRGLMADMPYDARGLHNIVPFYNQLRSQVQLTTG